MRMVVQAIREDILYFLTYAHTLSECLSEKSHIHAVSLLLDWITEFPGSESPKTKEPLIIDYDFVLDLDQHVRDVPQYLKDFVDESDEVKAKVREHFKKKIMPEVVSVFREDLYFRLWRLIHASDIAEVTVNRWQATYESGDMARFLADVFLYALQVRAPTISKNAKRAATKKQRDEEIASDIDRLTELFIRLGLPQQIPKPREIAPCEQAFIAPLYDAYGSIDGKPYARKQDLPPRLQRDIEVRRDHFYSAEAVRLQGENISSPIAVSQFRTLMDELFGAVYDVCYDDYANGYVRLKKVMEHVVSVPCPKTAYGRANWIGPEEKQGVCHMLAGENRLQWVIPDE